MSDESSSQPDEQPDGPPPFGAFGIPIPRAILAQMKAQHDASAEAADKLRVRYDSILQRFRVKMHMLTEGTTGLDGIGEQTYRLAFKLFAKAEREAMKINGFEPKVRKAITDSLREILDFVDFVPVCPHCQGTDDGHEHAPAGAGADPVGEVIEGLIAEVEAGNHDDAIRGAAADVQEYIDQTEVLQARLNAAGVRHEIVDDNPIFQPQVSLFQPTDIDAIRAFPGFLADLKRDFPGFTFTTKE